jgi:hypothetical protein
MNGKFPDGISAASASIQAKTVSFEIEVVTYPPIIII